MPFGYSPLLTALFNKAKQYAPTRQGINSAGEAILHAPFDAAGFIGDTLSKPVTDIPSELRGLHSMLTGHMLAAAHEMVNRANTPGVASTALNKLHNVIHQDTAAPNTPVQKYVAAGIRGGPGGLASQAATDIIPDGKWYKPAAVEAAGLAGMALPIVAGKFAKGVPEELTTGTDMVPSKGPVTTDGGPAKGDFSSARDAAQHIVDNKLGGSHDVVAHGDGSYSAVPRVTTPVETPEAPQTAPEAPQPAPQGVEAPSATQVPEAPVEAPQATPVEQQTDALMVTQPKDGSVAPDGLPGNGSVRPIDPAMMSRIMNDPGAIGQAPITTPLHEEMAENIPVSPSVTTSEEAPVTAPTQSTQQIPQGYEPPINEVQGTPAFKQAIQSYASDNGLSPNDVYASYHSLPERHPLIEDVNSRVSPYNTSEGPRVIREHGAFQEHPVPSDELPGTHALSYRANNGDMIRHIRMGIDPDGTAEMSIDPFSTAKNRVGPSEIRQAMKGLMEMYPEIKRFGGYRRSGAGAGRVQEITPSSPVPSPISRLMADQRGSLGPGDEPVDDPKATDGDPIVQKMTDALTDMAPLRKETSKQISQERSDRIAKATKAMYANEGEASLHAALGSLKGDMPKAIIPSIRDQFAPEEVTHLFNLVKNSNRVAGYEKINAMRALQKVLGEEYGEVPTEGELKLLGQVFPQHLIDAIQSHSLLEKVAGHATNILGIPRAIKTIGDLGVAFRQCSPLIGTKEFWQAFPSMFKGIASEDLYQKSFEAIKKMDTYPKMVEGKVAFTNMNSKLTEREEFAASKIAEHIPGVRQSERGFTGYLNTVRALTFDRLYNKALEKGANVDDPEVLKEIGNFVNILSGRGSLGDIGDKASPFLAAAFFSPRLQWSRLQLLTMPFNPKFYRMPGYLQKEYMRSVISYGLYMGLALGVLQHVFGAKVNNDPRSTDYGRAVIGKTRFDVSGSFQPYVRTVAQIATGQKVTATGKTEDLGKGFGTPTRLDTLVSFAESKASPNVDVILNELRGKDWEHPKSITGQEMDWKDPSMNNPAVDALIPMGIEAMMKAGDVYGYKSPLPYVAGAAETGGITANTYADPRHTAHHGFKGFSSGFKSNFKGFK